MSPETTERSFDELTRGLASGSISRGKAIRLMGAAVVGGVLTSLGIDGEASADQCKRNGKACKKNGQCCSGNCVNVNGTCSACTAGTTPCGTQCCQTGETCVNGACCPNAQVCDINPPFSDVMCCAPGSVC